MNSANLIKFDTDHDGPIYFNFGKEKYHTKMDKIKRAQIWTKDKLIKICLQRH